MDEKCSTRPQMPETVRRNRFLARLVRRFAIWHLRLNGSLYWLWVKHRFGAARLSPECSSVSAVGHLGEPDHRHCGSHRGVKLTTQCRGATCVMVPTRADRQPPPLDLGDTRILVWRGRTGDVR
jgi:hypothetical protein